MNPPALQEQDGQLPELRRKRELSSDDRKRVVSMLLLSLKDGALLPKLKQGAITEAANCFHVHCQTIRKIWHCMQENFANSHVKMFTWKRRYGNYACHTGTETFVEWRTQVAKECYIASQKLTLLNRSFMISIIMCMWMRSGFSSVKRNRSVHCSWWGGEREECPKQRSYIEGNVPLCCCQTKICWQWRWRKGM